MDERLAIGRIRGPHGVRGEMKVQSLSGEDVHFRNVETVWLKGQTNERQVKILSIRGSLPNLIVAFEGITTPEEARKYRGAEILADRMYAAPLADGEFYIADLIGCQCIYEGRVLATVQAVWENSSCDMLEVKCTDERIAQLPLQEVFVGDIDVDAKTIALKVDWILE